MDYYSTVKNPNLKGLYPDLNSLQDSMRISAGYIENLIRNKGSLDITHYISYNSKTKNFEYPTFFYVKNFDSVIEELTYALEKLYFELFCYVMPRLPGKNFRVCPVCDLPFFYITKKSKKHCSKACQV